MTAPEPYQWCFECDAEYTTAGDLLAAHNVALADLGLPQWTDVRHAVFCPECLHDFLYPPVEVNP